jgi:hypothetical protein
MGNAEASQQLYYPGSTNQPITDHQYTVHSEKARIIIMKQWFKKNYITGVPYVILLNRFDAIESANLIHEVGNELTDEMIEERKIVC